MNGSSMGTGLDDDEPFVEATRDLIRFLRHVEGCPTNIDGDEAACNCDLSARLDALRFLKDGYAIDVARCRRCGVHAITPDDTGDWAFKQVVPLPDWPAETHTFCHGCAVVGGA